MIREVEEVVGRSLAAAFNDIVQLDHGKRVELHKMFEGFDDQIKAVFGIKPVVAIVNPDVDNDGDVDEADLSIVHKEYSKQKKTTKKKTTKRTTKVKTK